MRQLAPFRFPGPPPPLRLMLVLVLALAAREAGSQQLQAPAELLQAGNSAYLALDWPGAARLFQQFLETYGADPAMADPVRKVQPLLALCLLRQGDFEGAGKPLAAALQDPAVDPAARSELRFFAGLGALRAGKQEQARSHLGAVFNDPKVDAARRMESLVLGGMSYVMEENWPGAVAFFQKYGQEIRAASPEAGGRADILHLHALTKAERWEEGLALAQDLAGRFDQVRQVVTFSSLLIELGSHFLAGDQPHKAIAALRLVRPRQEILDLQRARIEEAKEDLRYAEDSRNGVRQAQIAAGLKDMEKDLAGIEGMPQFDSASRLRMAQAYSLLGRTRETCLLLDQMVRQMPPDELVESASVNLIAGWVSLERWGRAARAAEVYVDRLGGLPIAKNLPGVLFAKAQALEGQFEHAKAAAAYAEVARRFPQDELAPKARFMEAYNVLQLEDYAAAGRLLDALTGALPAKHEMAEHVAFWRAMADYFSQDWEAARTRLDNYLEQAAAGAGTGEYVDDAIFRRGYAYFSEARYEPATEELLRLEREHPASEWLPEALLTLGDCYAAVGELDKALASYRRISPEAAGFHDEGWMKRGQVFKARKDFDGMKALYEEFLKARPRSPRVAEALNWLAWVAKQRGDAAGARAIYWDTLRRMGNEPAQPGLEESFLGLAALYSGEQKQELLALLRQERNAADQRQQANYAARLAWAEAQVLQRSQAAEARAKLASLGKKIEPKDTAPRVIVDCAEALAAEGDREGAARLFEGLRKWYPRAPERDRAFAGLGFLALERGDEQAALALFDRFERTAVLPKSAPDANGVSLVEAEIGGRVALARARLLESGGVDERALHLYAALQKSKAMPPRVRAEAFLAAAELHAKAGRTRESLPYYEQVYVLFNRYPDLVAKAYWGRGQALEKLGNPQLAREVYSELALREDLAGVPEAGRGRERASALGGVLKPVIPEGGEIPPDPARKGGAE